MTELTNFLSNLSVSELVDIQNEMFYAENTTTYLIFPMAELDDLIGMELPSEVIKRIRGGKFNYDDAYVYEDKNHNLFSFSRKTDSNFEDLVNIHSLAGYIIDTCNYLGNDKIMKYLINNGYIL